MNQKGIAHILIPLIIVVILIAVGAGLFFTGIVKNPFSSAIATPAPHPAADMTPLSTPPPPTQSEVTTPQASQSANPNPFDDSQEDSNPFSNYQNPFDNLQ